jgi:uncharacterized membrane protein
MKRILQVILFSLFAVNLNAQVSDDVELQEYAASSKSIFISYENAPRSVYIGEIFPIKLKAIITRDDYERIVTHVENDANFRILNLQSRWEKESGGQYFTNTFYFQALKAASKLPDFLIELVEGDRQVEQSEISGEEIETIKPAGDNRFSGVIAQSLAVKNEITNKFDDKSLIVTLEIETTYGNLKDFRLPSQNNGSLEVFKEDISLQYIEYDIIIPNYIQELEFTYFNTLSRAFELVKIPLNIKSDDISTHTDLNPKENKFKLYKDILLIAICALLLVIFVFKRYKILLIGAIVIVAYLLYINNPYNTIKISSNTPIRVLPTEKSSVFHITEGLLEVERLMSKNGYIKIMLPSGRIGWIKEENVAKN